MCNQIKFKVTFNCKKIASIQSFARASFDSSSGVGVAIVIKNEADKTLTLVFDNNIENYYKFDSYDFGFFNVHGNCFIDLDQTVKFVEGNYPKIVDGNYIKYTIPYVE